MRANNGLHLQVIKEAEKHDDRDRQWSAKYRHMQAAYSDLKFLYGQKTRQINSHELTISKLRTKMHNILEQKLSFNKESFQATARLEESGPLIEQKSLQQHGPAMVEIVGISESKIRSLEKRLSEYEGREVEWKAQEKVYLLAQRKREEEISRLAQQLESERNWDRVQVADELEDNKKTIRKLNQQIDFLNEERASLDERLKEYKDRDSPQWFKKAIQKKEDAINVLTKKYDSGLHEIKKLKHAIKEADSMFDYEKQQFTIQEKKLKKLWADKDDEMEGLREEYAKLMLELEQKSITLEELEQRIEDGTLMSEQAGKSDSVLEGVLQARIDEQRNEIETVKDTYTRVLNKLENTEKQLFKVTADYTDHQKASASTIARLEQECRESVEKCSQLSIQLGFASNTTNQTQSDVTKLKHQISVLQAAKQGVEKEKELYHQQYLATVKSLQNAKLENAEVETKSANTERSLIRCQDDLTSAREERQSMMNELQTENIRAQELQTQLLKQESEVARLNDIVSGMDIVQSQAAQAHQDANSTSMLKRKAERDVARATTTIQVLKKEKQQLLGRNTELASERDALTAVLAQFDKQLNGIQDDIRSLHQEKQALQGRCQQAAAELNMARDQLAEVKQEKTRLLVVIDSLKEDNAYYKQTVDSLDSTSKEKGEEINAYLKRFAEAKNLNQSLNLELEKLGEAKQQEEEEKMQLLEDIQGLKRKAMKLQDEIQRLKSENGLQEKNITKYQTQVEELKSLCRQVDKTRATAEKKLESLLEQEQVHKRDRNAKLEVERRLTEELQQCKGEISQLKQALITLDAERTSLTAKANQKQSIIDGMTAAQDQGRREQEDLNDTFETTKRQVETMAGELNNKDIQLESLMKQLAALNSEASRAQGEHAAKSKELATVVSDLRNMIKENQAVNQELTTTQGQRDQRAMELESMVTRVSHLEELTRAKERERDDLLSTYKAACQENERLKLAAQELDKERGEFRQEIRTLTTTVSQLQVKLAQEQDRRERALIDLHSLETQNSTLSQTLAKVQGELNDTRAEHHSLALDVNSARQVSQGLEAARVDHQWQLSELENANKNLTQQLSALRIENESLNKTIELNSTRLSELEELLSRARVERMQGEGKLQGELDAKTQAEADSQVKIKQLDSHITSLQEQLDNLHQYREKQTNEITSLMHKLAETVAVVNQAADQDDGAGAGAGLTVDSVEVKELTLKLAEQKKVMSTLSLKVEDLHKELTGKFDRIKILEQDKEKLKAIVYKYEEKVVKLEAQTE